MIDFTSKFPATSTSIFTEMSQLSALYQAINLGQGFPDYPVDPILIQGIHKAMQDGYNQYAPSAGYLALRTQIAQKAQLEIGVTFDPDTEILITPGATNGLFSTIATFVNPGDEVVYFDPAYDSYRPSILAVAGVPVPVTLQYPGFKLDIQLLAAAITHKTRMIILNTPHNPTGTTLQKEELDQLRDLLEGTNILILSDEVYSTILYDQKPHISPLSDPLLRARTIAVYSFGKIFNCTGWKTGYVLAPPDLMQEIFKVHQNNAFSTFSAVQIGLAAYMEDPTTYTRLAGSLQQKRDLLAAALKDSPLRPLPVKGSYFQLYSYEGFSSMTEKEFAIWLTKQVGVTSIPLSALAETFGDQKLIRFCFAKKEETLIEAGKRLSRLGKDFHPPY